MKPNPVTSFRYEDEVVCDVSGAGIGASSLECLRQLSDATILPQLSHPSSALSGAAPVDLNDVNNARSLAVLSVPPHSSVLEVGLGPGAVARALAARACHIWGIDIDSAATRLAEPWCDGILVGDVETADLNALLGPRRVDVILFLDVLQHLCDPAAAIRRVLPFLAPGGRMILSVPHGADASLRQLHFFDRSSLHDLLREAGVHPIDEARVVRPVEETDARRSLAIFPPEAIDLAAAGRDADTYQFVVTVAPDVSGTVFERMPTLVGTLTEHLHRLERNCRRLEERAGELESEVDRRQCENACLREALEEAREGHRRSLEEAAAVRADLRRSELEHEQSEEQLAGTADELGRCQLERRFLRDDVVVKDAYLATLRQQASLQEQLQAEICALTERLHDLTSEHTADVQRAADLALSNREIRQRLERSQHELHRVHTSVADTLAQPRYLLADRCNAWARKVRFLHAPLKRAWAVWSRGR